MNNKLQSLRQKLSKSRSFGIYLALCALVAMVLTAPRAHAVFTPIDFDPADMISQVQATAADIMPFVVALVLGGLVFRLIKRWAK